MRQIAVKVWMLTAIAVLMLAAQAQAVVTIEVGTVSAAAGSVADLPVTLDTGGDEVAAVHHDPLDDPVDRAADLRDQVRLHHAARGV